MSIKIIIILKQLIVGACIILVVDINRLDEHMLSMSL